MNDKELFVVIEEGGSLGEIHQRGRTRLATFKVFTDKEEAKRKTRRMSKAYGGGYYNYHYSTKTLEWAKKNLRASELENLL